MKGALDIYRMRYLTILVVFCLAASCWALAGRAWAVESAGLVLSIHTDKNQYLPGEPVQLILVLKYDEAEQQPIITKQGFSQNLELHRFLTITDPGGKTHRLGGVPKTHAMLPADYEDDEGREWRKTETLGDRIPVSETVADILPLAASLAEAPEILNMTGWFTLSASISSYVRYDPQQTRQHYVLGDLGRMGAPENYDKPIESNTVVFFVSPDQGAQFEVLVLDKDLPAGGVPVKVFRTAEIPPDTEPLDLWSGLPEAQPVLVGTTDLTDGTIKQWESGSPCQQQDGYTVIAYYGGQFGQAPIQAADDGWQPGCSGLISKILTFGESPPVDKTITVSGSGHNYPEGKRFKARFSMDVGTENGSPSGWLKYNYLRKWMFFASTEIAEVVGTDGNTATIRGRGTVNGAGNYTFEAVVTDNNPDSIGITIKDQNGNTYYSASSKNISKGDLKVTIGEEPPPVDKIVTVWGSASNYPKGKRHKANFSMDISTESGSPSGWLKYNYKRKWWFFRVQMSFASIEITEVVGSDGNTATIRGRGTVNGAGNYTFEAVVTDNNPDNFGITIKAPYGKTYYRGPSKNISDGNLNVTIE